MIRHAEPDRDADACARVYAPAVRDGVASFEEVVPDAAAMAQRIATISRTHAWLVCEREGEVAGYAYAGHHHDRAAYRWAADTTVYVHPDHQRAGVGRELYTPLLALLRAQGLHVACAAISLPNAASVALHERFGFRPVGVYRAVGFKADAWWDVGWWQLELGGSRPQRPSEPLGPQRLDDLPAA